MRDPTDLLDERPRAAHASTLVATGDDLALEVRDGSAHEVSADVDAHHPTRRRVELVEHGGRALAAASPCAR